jgi:hypothetical protein
LFHVVYLLKIFRAPGLLTKLQRHLGSKTTVKF